MDRTPADTNPYTAASVTQTTQSQGSGPAGPVVGDFNGAPVQQLAPDDKVRNGRETKHAHAQEQQLASPSLRKRKAEGLPANPDAVPAGGKDGKHVGGGGTPGVRGEAEPSSSSVSQQHARPADTPAQAALRASCTRLCARGKALLALEQAPGMLPKLSDWEKEGGQLALELDRLAGAFDRAAEPSHDHAALRAEVDGVQKRLVDRLAAPGIGKLKTSELDDAVLMPFFAGHLQAGDHGQVRAAARALMLRLGPCESPPALRDRLLYALARQVRAQPVPAGQALEAVLDMRIHALLLGLALRADRLAFTEAAICQSMRNVDLPAAADSDRTARACVRPALRAVSILLRSDSSDDTVARLLRCLLPSPRDLPVGDARRWFVDRNFASMLMHIVHCVCGADIPLQRCELIVNHVLGFAAHADLPARCVESMICGIALALGLAPGSERCTWLIQRVTGPSALAPAARGRTVLSILLLAQGLTGATVTPAMAAQIVQVARRLGPAHVGRLIGGLLAYDAQSPQPTGLNPNLQMAMESSGDDMTRGQMLILACSFAIGTGVREASAAQRRQAVAGFQPELAAGVEPTLQHRFGGLGVRMASRPSCVLDEAGLTPQEQRAFLTYVYQIPGVLDEDTAQAEFGRLASAKVDARMRTDLLSCLFLHGAQFLGTQALRAARELMVNDALRLQPAPSPAPEVPGSARAWSLLGEPADAKTWEPVADAYELATPLAGLHQALLGAKGLGFVYDTPPDPARVQAMRPALQAYREFMEGEIAEIMASRLSQDMKNAVRMAFGTPLARVVDALAAAPTPTSTSTTTTSSSSSSSISRSDAKSDDTDAIQPLD